jgi:hypothetical protein
MEFALVEGESSLSDKVRMAPPSPAANTWPSGEIFIHEIEILSIPLPRRERRPGFPCIGGLMQEARLQGEAGGR